MIDVIKYEIFANGTSRMEKIPKPDELEFDGKKWTSDDLEGFTTHFPKEKIPLTALNAEGENLLQYCARMKESEAVGYLLGCLKELTGDKKIFVDEVFVNNQSTAGREDTVLTDIALHTTEYLDKFLELTPAPSITNQGGDITLNLIDSLEIYKKILLYTAEKEPSILSNANTRGRTPLMMAAYNKELSHVKLLVETVSSCKSSLLKGSYSGYNALHYAGFNGNVEILEYLRGVLISDGKTGKEIDESIMQLSQFRRSMLHESAQHGFHGNHKMVLHLLKTYGVENIEGTETPINLFDPRVRDERGYNILHYAFVKSDRHSLTEEQTDKLQLIKHLHKTVDLDINAPAVGLQSYFWLFRYTNSGQINHNISNLHNKISRLKKCNGKLQDLKLKEHVEGLRSEGLGRIKEFRVESKTVGSTQYPTFEGFKLTVRAGISKLQQPLRADVSGIDAIKGQINEQRNEQYIIFHTPLSIAIRFGNAEGVQYALDNGALFDITALMALEELKKPGNKNNDRYEAVKNHLIEKNILNESGEIKDDQVPIILQNTQTIFGEIDIDEYLATMTGSVQGALDVAKPLAVNVVESGLSAAGNKGSPTGFGALTEAGCTALETAPGKPPAATNVR